MSEVRQRRQQGDEASPQGVARGISRDLDAARQAYAAGDPDASRRAHVSASAASNVGTTEGGHATASM